MDTYASKSRENKSLYLARDVSQKQNDRESAFQLKDNRPEVLVQRKLQEMANNSHQTHQIARLQAMTNQHVSLVQKKADLDGQQISQGKFDIVQRQGPEEEELMQGKSDTVQRQED